MGIEGIELLTRPEVTDPATEDADPIFTHIVGPLYTDSGKISGHERVLEAMVNGTPVEALCGYLWVPFRDPEKHPPCERCVAIAQRGVDD